MGAPSSIGKLVREYEAELLKSRPEGSAADSNPYVRKLLRALAWSANQGSIGAIADEHQLRVVAEGTDDVRRPPQLSLLLGGERTCFVGIQTDSSLFERAALPLRRFTWSADLPASILSNFENFIVYSGRVPARPGDDVGTGQIERFHYTEYEKRWDEISDLLSPAAVANGNLERAANNLEGVQPVGDAFLEELEQWRLRLARSLDARNRGLSLHELNFAVQLLIDRIVFLRICEDRGIEVYGQLKGLLKRPNAYHGLLEQFDRANARYNAGLFRLDVGSVRGVNAGILSSELSVDDVVIREMLDALYYPKSLYEFSVVSADILGQVYERFLGNLIVRTPAGVVDVEQKPEVRKAGGVYYTPGHVVRSIVRNTVGKLCENKTPDEVGLLRILDPSCGSGSFLNATYEYLLEWHKRYYIAQGVKQHITRIQGTARDGYTLTFEERKRILLNNVYGVDIDEQAIEITKLSLLLKVLEAESHGVTRMQAVLVRNLPLPDLSSNIVCGNSLIAPDFTPRASMLTEEERTRYVPFDYEAAFPTVFQSERSGFDAVIGNPPYLSYSGRQSVGLPKQVRDYFKWKYLQDGWPAAHSYFMSRAATSLSRHYVSFIVPDQVGHLRSYAPIRKALLKHGGLIEVHYRGEDVFKDANTPALTFVVDKTFRGLTKLIEEDGSTQVGPISGDASWNISAFQRMIDRLGVGSFSIDAWVRDPGIRTNKKSTQVIPLAKMQDSDVPVLEGKCINRYRCEPPRNAVRMDVGNVDAFDKAVFLIRQTGRELIVGPHEHTSYFRNSLLALDAHDQWPHVHYIVGLLNSRLMKFIYTQTVRGSRQKLFPQVTTDALGTLPFRCLRQDVPEERAFHDTIVRNVRELLELHRSLATASTEDLAFLGAQIALVDDRIDRLVFRLYGLSKDEVAIVKRETGQKPAETVDAARAVEDKSSDALWEHVEKGPNDPLWNEALEELNAREDPYVAPFVAGMLQRDALSPEVARALVFAAAEADCFEADVRRSLADGLLKMALAMRDRGDERPLWAAIRRFASIVPVTEVDALLSFLRDNDTSTTKQLIFQCIQNIFSVDFPINCNAVNALRTRVHDLAIKVIDPSRIRDAADVPHALAVALEAFCAAAALRDRDLPSMRERLQSLGRSYLVTRATTFENSLPRDEQETSP